MSEKAAWQTLRGELKKLGGHIQRFEDKLAVGVPDCNWCWEGVECWLEGKYVELPKRATTLVRVGLKKEQAAWLRMRARAGGHGAVWCRVKGQGWALFTTDFDRLVEGVDQRYVADRTLKTAKDLVKELTWWLSTANDCRVADWRLGR